MLKNIKKIILLLIIFSVLWPLFLANIVLAADDNGEMEGIAPKPLSIQTSTRSFNTSTLSEDQEFSWCCSYLDPAPPASVTWDIIYYYIYLQNTSVGDVFKWDLYYPVLDPETYLPTGSMEYYSSATWTRIDEENWRFCTESGLLGWYCPTTYYYPSGTGEWGAGPYIANKSFVTSHPGVWRISISRNGVLLASTNFDLVDDLAPTVTFISPADGEKLKGSSTTISVTDSDNLAVTRLQLIAENITTEQSFLLQTFSKPVPSSFSYSWDASNFPEGDYILRATAYDPYNNAGTQTVSVILNRGTEPPLPPEELVPSESMALTKDPINIATGEAYFSSTDFAFSGRGPALSLSRAYRSYSAFEGMFGYGWRTAFDINLSQENNGNVKIFKGDGTGIYFINNSGSFVPSPGNHTTLTSNSDNTFTLTDKNGNVSVYDANGRLSTRTDRNGNSLTFVYDPTSGGESYIQDATGRRIHLEFDSAGRVISAVSPAGKTFYYSYDANGNLITITDPEEGVTNYYYDSDHKITQLTNANGHSTYFEYDVQGRATANYQDNFVNEVTLNYQENNTTVVTDSLGNSSTYVFSPAGLLLSHTDPLGEVTRQTWDNFMNRTSITDARNNVTSFTYDVYGNLIQITDPLGHKTEMTYTADFNLIDTETDALGNVTQYLYDPQGNLTSVIDVLGNARSFVYDQFGNVIESTDSRGNTTDFTYDGLDHVIQTTDALGNNTDFIYE